LTRPDLNATEVFAGFRDYWIAKAGKDGVKLDWLATWRNWIRNERTKQQPKGEKYGRPTQFDHIARGIAEARAAREQEASR